MIDTIVSILGYSGSDPVVTYIVSAGSVALTLCLAYKFIDFLFSVVTAILGRDDKFKF